MQSATPEENLLVNNVQINLACRLCIACKTSNKGVGLLRFVRAENGDIYFDVGEKLAGRAAYVCANGECLQKAIFKKAFNRAFKNICNVDFGPMFSATKDVLLKRILENLGLSYRIGQCIAGRTLVMKEGTSRKYSALILSEDLSAHSSRDWNSGVDGNCKTDVLLKGPTKLLIGNALGRPETGVVALLKGRISERIINDLMRWRSLSDFSIL
ncbi:MAG: DUF448 domain-containing protein [bacterium]|nr:DUF448 domain-containing protein [bacterium]